MQPVSVAEAQQQAAFTVLTPDPLPAGWRHRPPCLYVAARSWSSARVVLNYLGATGGQRVSIIQLAAADAAQAYGMILAGDNWHEVLSEGTLINIQPTAQRLYAQVHLTRHGTFAYLKSEGLTTEELITIAASLRPAPDTDDG